MIIKNLKGDIIAEEEEDEEEDTNLTIKNCAGVEINYCKPTKYGDNDDNDDNDDDDDDCPTDSDTEDEMIPTQGSMKIHKRDIDGKPISFVIHDELQASSFDDVSVTTRSLEKRRDPPLPRVGAYGGAGDYIKLSSFDDKFIPASYDSKSIPKKKFFTPEKVQPILESFNKAHLPKKLNFDVEDVEEDDKSNIDTFKSATMICDEDKLPICKSRNTCDSKSVSNIVVEDIDIAPVKVANETMFPNEEASDVSLNESRNIRASINMQEEISLIDAVIVSRVFDKCQKQSTDAYSKTKNIFDSAILNRLQNDNSSSATIKNRAETTKSDEQNTANPELIKPFITHKIDDSPMECDVVIDGIGIHDVEEEEDEEEEEEEQEKEQENEEEKEVEQSIIEVDNAAISQLSDILPTNETLKDSSTPVGVETAEKEIECYKPTVTNTGQLTDESSEHLHQRVEFEELVVENDGGYQLEAEVETDRLEAEVETDQLETEVETDQLETEVETDQLEAEVETDQLEAEVETDQLEAEMETDQLEAEVETDQLEADVKADQLQAEVETDQLEAEEETDQLEAEEETDQLEAEMETDRLEAEVETDQQQPADTDEHISIETSTTCRRRDTTANIISDNDLMINEDVYLHEQSKQGEDEPADLYNEYSSFKAMSTSSKDDSYVSSIEVNRSQFISQLIISIISTNN